MLRVPLLSVSASRPTARKLILNLGSNRMEATVETGIHQASSTSPRREPPTVENDEAPRKRSRKSTIMDALRRSASMAQAQIATAEGSRQLSTVASMATAASAVAPSLSSVSQPASPSHVSPPAPSNYTPRLAPTGLPFYTHTESVTLAGLPPIPPSRVHYFRFCNEHRSAPEDVNFAIARMINNLQSPPGSQWQGVVGFDMEWTVPYSKGSIKTGLIQLADEREILLIQISSMKFMPSKLKAIITSPTILKVGVNILGDMRRICQQYGADYAGRGILDLSHMAKVVDVGLVGTRLGDMDSNQAHVGIGIKKDQALSSTPSASDIIEDESDLGKRDDTLDAESTTSNKKSTSSAARGIDPSDKLVRTGKILIQLARLSRRYLQRELEKGDERTSNWDIRLSQEQRRYAANDAHAGLALYHALRSVHAQSVAAGIIPVPVPPPWEQSTPAVDVSPPSPSSSKPIASPPFRSKTVPAKTSRQPEPELVSVDQLQDLSPSQLESLLPWSDLVVDLRAEMDAARAAVQAKRAKEGVDINGKGEAVVAAEAAEAATVKSVINPTASSVIEESSTGSSSSAPEPLKKPSTGAYSSTPIILRRVSPSIPRPKPVFLNNPADTPSKGTTRVLARQLAAEKSNEVMGKTWPPTRVTAPNILKAVSSSSSSLPPTESRASSPASSSTVPATKPSPAQLRAYLLWHNRDLPLAQICAAMRSARYPLEKATVISHIVETLRLDRSLPFDATKLRALIDADPGAMEKHRTFLEDKLGSLD